MENSRSCGEQGQDNDQAPIEIFHVRENTTATSIFTVPAFPRRS